MELSKSRLASNNRNSAHRKHVRACPPNKPRLGFEALEDRRLLSVTPKLIADIQPGPQGSLAAEFVDFNGETYFRAFDNTGRFELWKTDGTDVGTEMIKDFYVNFLDFDNGFYSNGLSVLEGKLYFNANDGVHGHELWTTDGTPDGTVMVKDINPGPHSSKPYQLTSLNGAVYFSADGGPTGRELWKTDGTASGTTLVMDIFPGSFLFEDPNTLEEYIQGFGSSAAEITNVDGTLFFRAQDANNNLELWRSNGTAAGTTKVKEIFPGSTNGSTPGELTNVNGTLFFIGSDGVQGGLWRSNGMAAGTTLVKDLPPDIRSLTNVGGTLYFTAQDGATGRELWKSDGTEGGTVRVEDIFPGSGGSNPENLTNVDGTLFFTVDNGIYGRELWSVAPLVGAPMLVADIFPGAGGGPTQGQENLKFTSIDGKIFFSANDGIHGFELWTSDGTNSGTEMIADLLPGGGSSEPSAITNINGILIFSANDGVHGYELWTLAGTPISVPVDAETIEEDLQALVTQVQTTPTETGALPSELLLSINQDELTSVVTAIEGLTSNSVGPVVTISVTLSEGVYAGQDIAVPAGVRLVLNGAGGSITFEGHSPALTILSGDVVATGLTFVNSTDAPTILVQGGSLVVRNSSISETTGGARAAVEVTGGHADFGRLDDAGGNTFILSGPGEFVRNTSANSVPLFGNVFQTGAATISADFGVPALQRLIVDASGGLALAAAALSVDIDFVQPTVNIDQNGALAFVIFGSSQLDVTQVHASSLKLAGVSLDVYNQSVSDANNDGYADVKLHFRTSDALKAALTAMYGDALLDDYADDQQYAAKQDVILSLDGAFGAFGQEFHGTDSTSIFLAGKSLKALLASLGI